MCVCAIAPYMYGSQSITLGVGSLPECESWGLNSGMTANTFNLRPHVVKLLALTDLCTSASRVAGTKGMHQSAHLELSIWQVGWFVC